MPTWKKVIVSGSNAHLTSITASQVPTTATSGENVLVLGANGEIKQISPASLTGANTISFVTMSVGGLGGSTGSLLADASSDTLNISSSDANLIITAAQNGAVDTLSFDFADSPTFTNITASGDIAVNGGDITTNQANFNLLAGATGTLTIGAAATTNTLPGNLNVSGNTTLGDAGGDSVTVTAQTVTLQNPLSSTATVGNILVLTSSNRIATQSIDTRVFGTSLVDATNGANDRIATFTDGDSITGESNLTFNGTTFAVSTGFTATTTGNVVIAGDLTVNGTTTTIDTTNLLVEDKFIILAHGSGSQTPIAEGGIIVEGSTADKGQAFLFNSGSTANVTGRWGLAADVHMTSSEVTPTDFVVSVSQSAAAPLDANPPSYGGSNGGFGNMYIQTSGEIWIYS